MVESLRLDNILIEIELVLKRLDDGDVDLDSCDTDDLARIGRQALRSIQIQLRLKNARIKELHNMFLRN